MSKTLEIHCTDFNALNAMYVEDVGDTLLHAAWSVQDIRIILYICLIIFQVNLSNVEDVEDYKGNDNK